MGKQIKILQLIHHPFQVLSFYRRIMAQSIGNRQHGLDTQRFYIRWLAMFIVLLNDR